VGKECGKECGKPPRRPPAHRTHVEPGGPATLPGERGGGKEGEGHECEQPHHVLEAVVRLLLLLLLPACECARGGVMHRRALIWAGVRGAESARGGEGAASERQLGGKTQPGGSVACTLAHLPVPPDWPVDEGGRLGVQYAERPRVNVFAGSPSIRGTFLRRSLLRYRGCNG